MSRPDLVSELRPRMPLLATDYPVSRQAQVVASVIFIVLVGFIAALNRDFDWQGGWLALLPFVIAGAITLIFGVRLEGIIFAGFAPISTLIFGLMIGFERAVLAQLIGFVLALSLGQVFLRRAGIPAGGRRSIMMDSLYSQGTGGLIILASGWLYQTLVAGSGFKVEAAFPWVAILYFLLCSLFTSIWLRLRHADVVDFARRYWHLMLLNNFLATGLAPITAPLLAANASGITGQLLYTFGFLLLTVLNNGYLDISRRLDHLATLNSIGRALAANLDLDDLLRIVRQEIGLLVDVSNLYLALYDEQSGTISFPVDYEENVALPPSQIQFGSGSLTEHVLRSHEPLLISHDVNAFLSRNGITPVSRVGLSYLGVPIFGGERVIGVLALRSFKREHAFSRDDVALLQSIATQVGVALQNAQLYHQSRRQASELSSLNRLASLVVASTDLHRLVSSVCHMVIEVMGYDKAAVWLLEPGGGTARLMDSVGLSDEFRASAAVMTLGESRAEVFRTRQPVVIQDVLQIERFADVASVARKENFRAVLEVPLMVGSNIIGSVAAYYAEPRQIGLNEIELLQTLTGLIAVAVENARLFETLTSRSRELATLYEASESLNASLSLKNVLRALSVTLIQALHTPSCSIWLTDESGEALTTALHMIEVDGGGHEKPTVPIELVLKELPVIQQAVTRRQPVFVLHDQTDLSPGSQRLLEYVELESALILPLVMHGRLIGVLVAAPPKNQPDFQLEQVRLAEALANQAAAAIDNAQRFERTDSALSSRVEELSALERVLRRMTSQLDLQLVIDEVAQAAITACGVEYIDIALLDEATQKVTTILRRTAVPEEGVAMEWSAANGLTGQSLRTRQVVRVGDVTQTQAYLKARPDVRSELVVPIVVGDRVIGVLNLESPRLNAFTEEHERFLSHLAEYAAIAIANARLFESERRQRQIAEILLETSAAVTSSPSLSDVLVTLAQQLLKISGFHGCTIMEWDQEDGKGRVLAEHVRSVWTAGGEQVCAFSDYPTAARVVSTGKAAVLDRSMSDRDSSEVSWMEESGLNTQIMLPVKAGKQVIGLAKIASPRNDVAADQTALRRCERIMKEAADWLVAPLHANPPEHLFDLAQRLNQACGYSLCFFYSLDRHKKSLSTFVEYGDLFWQSARGPSVNVADQPVIAEVLEKVVSKSSRVAASNKPSDQGLGRIWGLRTLVTQPLTRKGQPIGIVQLFNVNEEQAISEDELRLWRLVGDQAAVAIENANLFEAVQRRSDESSTLRSLAVELMAAGDLEQNLRTICRHAIERTSAQEVFIYLYDQAQDQLTFGASLRRTTEIDQEAIPLHLSGITAAVVRSGETQVIGDVAHHPMFAGVSEPLVWKGITSMVGVPLRSSGRMVGVFAATFADSAHLSSETMHFLDLLAAQAAVAIERTRLAEETRTGRDRLEAVLNSSHDGLMLFDPSQRLVLANPRTEYLLNVRVADMIQRHYLNIMQRIAETLNNQERDAWLQESIRIAGSIGDDPLTITRRRFTLGTTAPRAIEETSIAVTDAQDQVIGRLFVLHDVTDQVELEAYRQELSGMIVHNLRSPLASLITGLEMALQELEDVPKGPYLEPIRATLDVSLTSGNTLLKLVEAILDISKLETGELPLALEPVNLRSLAQTARERLRPVAAEAHIDVNINAPRRLPEIIADPQLIEQVLGNLLDNALHYTPHDGHIEIDIQAEPTHQTVSVIDNGEGIAPEYRERIFERFFQIGGRGRKRGTKGSGLGLTFCQLAVEAHRGRIWIDDGPEGGAAFHFTLPTDPGLTDRVKV